MTKRTPKPKCPKCGGYRYTGLSVSNDEKKVALHCIACGWVKTVGICIALAALLPLVTKEKKNET